MYFKLSKANALMFAKGKVLNLLVLNFGQERIFSMEALKTGKSNR